MRTGWMAAVCLLVCLAGTRRAGAQALDEPDPCADAVGVAEQGSCWQRQAEQADAEMNEAADALAATLPRRYWVEINERLVPFGKWICTGGLPPKCSTCLLLSLCRQVGVGKTR